MNAYLCYYYNHVFTDPYHHAPIIYCFLFDAEVVADVRGFLKNPVLCFLAKDFLHLLQNDFIKYM
jgi:hypothetical protein